MHGYLPSGTFAGVIEDRPTCASWCARIVARGGGDAGATGARESGRLVPCPSYRMHLKDGVAEVRDRPPAGERPRQRADGRQPRRRADAPRRRRRRALHRDPRRGARLLRGRGRQGARRRRRRADRRRESRLLRHAFAAIYDCRVPVITAVSRLLPGRRDRASRARPTSRSRPRTQRSAFPRSTAARSARRRT